MSALGKVCTGFSKPYVALYANNEGTITYSDGQRLARGVEVSIEPESSDASNFYADNIIAETVGGQFTGGTCTLTVDGLLQDAEKLIAGLPTADTDGFLNYGLDQSTPFVGLGFVVRYLSGGTTYYTPVILTKATLNPQTLEAATQEDEVDFQTQELEFTLSRDDSTNGVWKKVGGELASESAAETVIKGFFNIQ
jgi:phi13 family phage major tail protein